MNTRMGPAGFGIAAALAVTALAAAGCSSGGGGGLIAQVRPPWANALGPGVTVTGPGGASAGDGSPGGVMLGVVGAFQSGHYSKLCTLLDPSVQAQCKAEAGGGTEPAPGEAPTFTNFTVSYTAIDGDRALVGTTGTVCDPQQTPECYTNKNPAAILDSGQTFAALWTESVSASGSAYSLAPVVKVNGTWYGYSTP